VAFLPWRTWTPGIHPKEQNPPALKNFSETNDGSTPHTITAPASSIRDLTRNSSRSGSNGHHEHTRSTYNLEEVLSKRAPSSPQQGHANETEKQGDKTASNEDGPQHCYCDEYYQACTSITPCELHDGFFCNGCDDWFHATCTGWGIVGDPPNRYMESKMYPDFKIPLGSLSQEDPQPWYIASDAGKTKSLKTQHSYLGLIVVCNKRYFVLGLK
jgi:hypothetical protein